MIGLPFVTSLAFANERSASSADLAFQGGDANASVGDAVATGDVNGDGNDDLLLGAPNANGGSGYVYLILGPDSGAFGPVGATATISGAAASDHAGSAIYAASDFDGDGSDDVLIGAPDYGTTDYGRAYLFYGPLSGSLSVTSADASFTATSSGNLGVALDGFDLDGDGYEDIFIGSSEVNSNKGKVYTWMGSGVPYAGAQSVSGADYTYEGVQSGEAAGYRLTHGVYGGIPTLVVAAPAYDYGTTNNGILYMIEQNPTPADGQLNTVATNTILGLADITRMGERLASGFDSDGNGNSELLASNDNGETLLFYAPQNALDSGDRDAEFNGAGANILAVSGAGDVDRDGYDDFLIGDSGSNYDGNGSAEGATFLMYGSGTTFSGLVNTSTSADVVFDGGASGDYMGFQVASGDFNADGKSDVVSTASEDHISTLSDAGSGMLFYGPFTRLEGAFDLVDADSILYGDDSGDQSGYSVAGVGDVNCDGVPDLAVGAILGDETSTATGALYVLFGPTPASSPLEWLNTAIDLGTADFIFYETSAADLAGNTVVGVGDVDGDACDDFLIAASGNDDAATNAGAVYLFYGDSSLSGTYGPTDADAEFQGTNANDYFGTGVGAGGDLDDDGYDDILIGQPYTDSSGTDNGRAVVFFGGSGANLLSGVIASDDADCKYRGEDADDRAGWKVRGDFDFNGDGDLDIAIGAPGNEDAGTNAGAVYVILGDGTRCSGSQSLTTADVEIDGAAAGDQLGHALATLADLDGDGYDDILAGAPYANSDGGFAYWIPGSTSTGVATTPRGGTCFYSTAGANGDGRMGWSVAGPDLDGDGNDDLFVGSPWVYNGGASKAGAAYLFYADTATPWKADGLCHGPADADIVLTGEVSQDFAGWSVADAGDLNQDGEDDLLIGAYGNDDGGTTAGAAYVVLASH